MTHWHRSCHMVGPIMWRGLGFQASTLPLCKCRPVRPLFITIHTYQRNNDVRPPTSCQSMSIPTAFQWPEVLTPDVYHVAAMDRGCHVDSEPTIVLRGIGCSRSMAKVAQVPRTDVDCCAGAWKPLPTVAGRMDSIPWSGAETGGEAQSDLGEEFG